MFRFSIAQMILTLVIRLTFASLIFNESVTFLWKSTFETHVDFFNFFLATRESCRLPLLFFDNMRRSAANLDLREQVGVESAVNRDVILWLTFFEVIVLRIES